MKKNITLSIFFFIFGFLTHAFFFPEVLSNGITDVKNLVIPNLTPTGAADQPKDPLITKITFDGAHFSRHNITIGFTRYVEIVNTSTDKLMSLESSIPQLTTPRGYGESEAVQMQGNKKGQFMVADKNNPAEKLVITVK
ncbi:MAG: hypothetical protein ACR2LN_05050 [Candidatus Levyibacteriota bacterium]